MTTNQLTFNYSSMKEVEYIISTGDDNSNTFISEEGVNDYVANLIHRVLPCVDLFWEVYLSIPEDYSGEDKVSLTFEKNDDGDLTSFTILSPQELMTEKVILN